jgi:hypothetical protein
MTKEEYIAMVKTINQLRKEKQHLIDKACEFLYKTIWNITYEDLEGNSTENTDKIKFIETFKTYIKGE